MNYRSRCALLLCIFEPIKLFTSGFNHSLLFYFKADIVALFFCFFSKNTAYHDVLMSANIKLNLFYAF